MAIIQSVNDVRVNSLSLRENVDPRTKRINTNFLLLLQNAEMIFGYNTNLRNGQAAADRVVPFYVSPEAELKIRNGDAPESMFVSYDQWSDDLELFAALCETHRGSCCYEKYAPLDDDGAPKKGIVDGQHPMTKMIKDYLRRKQWRNN